MISETYYSSRLLMAAVHQGDLTQIQSLIMEADADVNYRSNGNCTTGGFDPLRTDNGIGGSNSRPSGLSPYGYLLSEGTTGDTPLHVACQDGLLSVVELLLAFGASPNIKRTAAAGGQTALHVAVIKGDYNVVDRLLNNRRHGEMEDEINCHVNNVSIGYNRAVVPFVGVVTESVANAFFANNYSCGGIVAGTAPFKPSCTAIDAAAARKGRELSRMQLGRSVKSSTGSSGGKAGSGRRVNKPSTNFRPPTTASLSVLSPSVTNASLLAPVVEGGAADPSLADALGRLPLHYAAAAGDLRMVQMLVLDGGCSRYYNVTDGVGMTPRDLALSASHHAVADFLKDPFMIAGGKMTILPRTPGSELKEGHGFEPQYPSLPLGATPATLGDNNASRLSLTLPSPTNPSYKASSIAFAIQPVDGSGSGLASGNLCKDLGTYVMDADLAALTYANYNSVDLTNKNNILSGAIDPSTMLALANTLIYSNLDNRKGTDLSKGANQLQQQGQNESLVAKKKGEEATVAATFTPLKIEDDFVKENITKLRDENSAVSLQWYSTVGTEGRFGPGKKL